MNPAQSLSDMIQETDKTLGEHNQRVLLPTFPLPAGYVAAGAPSQLKMRWVDQKTVQWSKLIGILFCLPSSDIATKEVLPNLEYFNYRSEFFVDFFCVGYATQPEGAEHGPDIKAVAEVGGTKWIFNAAAFNHTRGELAERAKWKFSGETDLVLAVARKPKEQTAVIDFTTSISCKLEQMIRDEAITSVRAFFEQIFQFGELYSGSDPVFELSDKLGIRAGGNFLLEAVLTLVPEAVRKGYKAARHFAIQDISKQ